MPEPKSAEEWARWLHERYEILSRLAGWQTQQSTRVEFDDLPSANKEVMLHLATELEAQIYAYARQQVEAWKAARLDWLAHRCDYSPPCGRCAYCRIRETFRALPVEGP